MASIIQRVTGSVRSAMSRFTSTGNKIADEILGKPKTRGYKPQLAGSPAWMVPNIGYFNLADVDVMRLDPQVSLCLAYRKAPIATAEFPWPAVKDPDGTVHGIVCDDQEVGEFVHRQILRIWTRSLGAILESHDFGYSASEVLYEQTVGGRWDGAVEFKGLKGLHPRDVTAYSRDGMLDYIQVRSVIPKEDNAANQHGYIELDAAKANKPAKGLWITHGGRYNNFYGRSVLFPAWRPWKDKCNVDGANDMVRMWFHRAAFSGFTIFAPKEIYQEDENAPPVDGLAYARQLAEWLKTGGNAILENTRDDKGNYLWEVRWPELKGDPDALLRYIMEFLDVQIQRGIGIPDGIITESGGTGAYAGRRIPEDAFYVMCEEDLNHIVMTVLDQILRPLVHLNHGPGKKFDVVPKRLVPIRQQEAQGQGGGAPPMPPAGQPEQQNPQAGGFEDMPDVAQFSLRLSHGPHSYASTQFNLPPKVAEQFKAFAAEFPSDHLAEDGVESDPHITLKYGLHSDDPERLKQVLQKLKPVTVTLGEVSVFSNDEHDVVKVEVLGQDIHTLHEVIKLMLANTETWPNYKPHATIAYLKRGKGKKYVGDKRFEGTQLTFDSVVFSTTAGTKHVLPLSDLPAPDVGNDTPFAWKLSNWQRYRSRTGNTAWKNVVTGEIRYQLKEPQDREAKRDANVGNVLRDVSYGRERVAAGRERDVARSITTPEQPKPQPKPAAPVPQKSKPDTYAVQEDVAKPPPVRNPNAPKEGDISKPPPVRHPNAPPAQNLEKKAAAFLKSARGFPKAMVRKTTHLVATRFKKMEARYGRKTAIAVMAASIALTPIPAPGTSLLPVALAEVWRRIRKPQPTTRMSKWVQYTGKHGGAGWKHQQTGEIRYQQERPRDGKAAPKPTTNRRASKDPAANRPSKPNERHKVSPPVRAFKAPPPPKGTAAKQVGGYAANGQTNTSVADQAEALLTKLGMRSILPPGERRNPLDVEFDHSGWGFEVKAVTVNAREYKAKPKAKEMASKRAYAKKHKLRPATMIAVMDYEAGTMKAYWREGIGAFRLTPNEDGSNWNYLGTVNITSGKVTLALRANEWHGPQPPGDPKNWVFVREGPRGGKIWRYRGKMQDEAPVKGRIEFKGTETGSAFLAADSRKDTAKLAATNKELQRQHGIKLEKSARVSPEVEYGFHYAASRLPEGLRNALRQLNVTVRLVTPADQPPRRFQVGDASYVAAGQANYQKNTVTVWEFKNKTSAEEVAGTISHELGHFGLAILASIASKTQDPELMSAMHRFSVATHKEGGVTKYADNYVKNDDTTDIWAAKDSQADAVGLSRATNENFAELVELATTASYDKKRAKEFATVRHKHRATLASFKRLWDKLTPKFKAVPFEVL